jgi:hypothetical protein
MITDETGSEHSKALLLVSQHRDPSAGRRAPRALVTIWRHEGQCRSLAQVSGSYGIIRRVVSVGAVAALWCCTLSGSSSRRPLGHKVAAVLSKQVVYLAISAYERVDRHARGDG